MKISATPIQYQRWILYLLLIPATIATAQPHALCTLRMDSISTVSVDRLGNIYFILANHRIQKYDPNGKLIGKTLSPTPQLSLIEPWNPLKIFIYSQTHQRYTILDRDLKPIESQNIKLPVKAPPELVCPGNRPYEVWTLNHIHNAVSIQKANLRSMAVDVSESLPKKWIDGSSRITFMCYHQNNLFLLDPKKGIYMLSAIGKPIAHLPIPGLSFFNFVGEELCYVKGNDIVFMDLRTGKKRIIENQNPIEDLQFAIVTDIRLVIIADCKAYFFDLTS